MIVILDYGSGNIKSVFNLLKTITKQVCVSSDSNVIKNASHLILPGVGSFPAVKKKIQKTLPTELVSQLIIEEKVPFLGICVGMQLLSDQGFELEPTDGFGLIKGEVNSLAVSPLALPHIGWNNLTNIKQCTLLNGINETDDFYFVHSYHFKCAHNENSMASAEYNQTFSAVVQKDNIWGVQFHPEKSQQPGKIILENFVKEKC